MQNALRKALVTAHVNPADYPKGIPQSDEQKALAAPHIVSRHLARGEVITAAEAREKYVKVIAAMLESVDVEAIRARVEDADAEAANALQEVRGGFYGLRQSRDRIAKLRGAAHEVNALIAAKERAAKARDQANRMRGILDKADAKQAEAARELHAAALRAGVNVPALPAVAAVKPKATVHAIRKMPKAETDAAGLHMTRRERELNGLK